VIGLLKTWMSILTGCVALATVIGAPILIGLHLPLWAGVVVVVLWFTLLIAAAVHFDA
jgi:hypothetical protein